MNLVIKYEEVHERERPVQPARDIILFSTKDSVIAVDSPIKAMILEMIISEDLPFDEIVSRVDRAKSTISVHVKDLEKSGLIRTTPDPRDQRKRILHMVSHRIGRLTTRDRDAVEKQIDRYDSNLPFAEDQVASFYRYLLRIFRTEAMTLGINMDPVLERAGYRVGLILKPLVADDELTKKIEKMDRFWEKYSLGRVVLKWSDPITLEVAGCFECMDLPVTGHGACAFDTGVLTALFEDDLHGQVRVTEIECYASGYDHCTFQITRSDRQ